MRRKKLTVSVPEELADYLRAQPNASAVVAEAVEEYRARELEAVLENAYRAGAEEAQRLDEEWSGVDAEVTE